MVCIAKSVRRKEINTLKALTTTLQKMTFLNCVTVTQNMSIDGFLHPILRQNILARDDV